MRALLLASLSALALTAPAFAQNAPVFDEDTIATARELMDDGLDSDLAYALVEDLTTRIGPRLAGSDAEARAREWSVTTLKALGFDAVRVEPFDVPYWERRVERGAITAPAPQNLVLTALGGSVGTGPGGIEAQIVRFETLGDLRAAPESALEGKIAFVDEYTRRTQDGSGYGVGVAKRREAAELAEARGGLAAMIRSVGTQHRRLAHTGQMRRIGEPQAGVPAVALSPPDADQLGRLLELGPVTVKLDVEVETLTAAPSGNVVGEITGSERPEEIVLVGGHLDSWDLGTGAIDDGAGVAITTAAAKMIIDAGLKPKRTIRVVHFGSEEVGLVGARAYAQQHADTLKNHIVGAESDFGAGEIWRLTPNFGAEDWTVLRDAMLEVIGPLGVGPGPNSGTGGPDMSFVRQAGVPVISFTQNGWDYIDLQHPPDDTLDKIDPEALAQNVAVYAAFLWLVANSDVNFRAEPDAALGD
ncbi:MAG: M20/M25/M40 family metallo-hydrolase [Maricaulaceae bacterium]